MNTKRMTQFLFAFEEHDGSELIYCCQTAYSYWDWINITSFLEQDILQLKFIKGIYTPTAMPDLRKISLSI